MRTFLYTLHIVTCLSLIVVVLIQRGNLGSRLALADAGKTVIELDTDEFMKSGGSVFCMKLHHGPIDGDEDEPV